MPDAPAPRSQCPYCGVGCGLELLPPAAKGRATRRAEDGTPIWGARGDRAHPSTAGQVCVKGATVTQTLDGERLRQPLYRSSLDEPFQPVSWEQAIDRIVDQLQRTLASKGPEAIAAYGSGQFHTEDYYLAQKLFKGALGTNNFDANSRLCMSSAVAGYARSLGSDGPPCCYEDLDLCDAAFLVGTNTAECHPVLFQRLIKRRRGLLTASGPKLVVVDPRRTETARAADLHLAIRPGTDLVLLHGLAHLLLRQSSVDYEFLENATEGFFSYARLVQEWTPRRVARLCGIREKDLREAARIWARSKAVLSLWSMGVNQSVEGTATVAGLINLHLLTGQICGPGCGPFSLTGQPNAMGGREAGGLSHLLPGYRSVGDAEHRRQLEQAWGLPEGQIASSPGLSAWQQVEAMAEGRLDVWWVAATNPLVSMPNLERVRQAMRRCPLVIVSDAYAGTETAAFAHLVLPAAQWSEKEGVMTNSERRVTLCPAFRPAPGAARPDWQVFAEVGRRLGYEEQFSYGSAAEVYDEFAALTAGRLCDVSGLSHGLLREQGPQQWPHPRGAEPSSGSSRLYGDAVFPTPTGRARLIAEQPMGLAEPPDDDYPLVLTVGRYLGHWHTMTRTRQVPRLQGMHPQPLLEIHPEDARKVGLADGALACIRSRRGSLTAVASLDERIRPGLVFLPMHWGASQETPCEANALMHEQACPRSGQPELKAAAVQVLPAAETP
ncbi:nitrate reductase [Synechococcus sp. RSCCF101]|uniref:molybdopterin oxidoreductase family protein n=1 Tax=Synechococcus sp. RSCCF101 TaxID=2511069 RepID=UPI001245DAAA|nr:nitrate reductase [Synechococcus sp. RSCCF101]QEY32617.1 nitrate reductase [Synechococcus sp. RSCCF101]